jgi:hypothetical protein
MGTANARSLRALRERRRRCAGGTSRRGSATTALGARAASRLTHGTQPYRLADGTLIANSWTQLTSGGDLLHAIDRDETNAIVPEGTVVWTGTRTNGTTTLSTCMGWTLQGPANIGTVGTVKLAAGAWTNARTEDCRTGQRLYCLEE